MQRFKQILIFFLMIVPGLITAQLDSAVINYISTYKDLAMQEMTRSGIPAAIKLAQAIHESGAGQSILVRKSNNHFGIKCKTGWAGMKVRHSDDAPNECFRKYSTPEDSYRDHSDFLKNSSRYTSLFSLDPEDYKDWAYGLKRAGYATNPKYAQIIIKLIEDYHLQDYTLLAIGKIKPGEEFLAKEKEQIAVPEYSDSGPSQVLVQSDEREAGDQSATRENEKPGLVSAVAERNERRRTTPQYPPGEFKINDTRVIYAQAGTPYLVIAEQYQVPLSRLFEFNDMKPEESVSKNQLIYLMRKRKTGNNEYHLVMEGETLHDIAQTEAIRIESLLEYNSLKKDQKPVPGTQLNLRSRSTKPLATSSGGMQ